MPEVSVPIDPDGKIPVAKLDSKLELVLFEDSTIAEIRGEKSDSVDNSPYSFLYLEATQIADPVIERYSSSSDRIVNSYRVLNLIFLSASLFLMVYCYWNLVDPSDLGIVKSLSTIPYWENSFTGVLLIVLIYSPEIFVGYLCSSDYERIRINHRSKSSPYNLEGKVSLSSDLLIALKALILLCIFAYTDEGFKGGPLSIGIVVLIIYGVYLSDKIFRKVSAKHTSVDLLSVEDFHSRLMEIRLEKLSQRSTPIEELVAIGENAEIEFKSSFWTINDPGNEKVGQREKNLQERIVKEVAGFLNTEGGVLLIGIHDKDESCTGIQQDLDHSESSVSDADGLALHINNLLMNELSPMSSQMWKITFPNYKNDVICRIDIDKSTSPILARLKSKDGKKADHKHFYRRIGSMTEEPSQETGYAYVAKHFAQP